MNEGNDEDGDDDSALFRAAVGEVKALRHDRIYPERERPRPKRKRPVAHSMQRLFEEDGEHTPENWLAGEHLNYRRTGVQDSVIRKLRRGAYRIEAELDLHGHTEAGARLQTKHFLKQAREQQQRCVLIVHGKSGHDPERRAVLKNMLDYWLRGRREVLAFCSAGPAHGGTGAIYVLLSRLET